MKGYVSGAILSNKFRMVDSLNKRDIRNYDFENIYSLRIYFARQKSFNSISILCQNKRGIT